MSEYVLNRTTGAITGPFDDVSSYAYPGFFTSVNLGLLQDMSADLLFPGNNGRGAPGATGPTGPSGGGGGGDTVLYAGTAGRSSRTPGTFNPSSGPTPEGVTLYTPVWFKDGDVIAEVGIFGGAGDGASVTDVGLYDSTAGGFPGAKIGSISAPFDTTISPAPAAMGATIPASGLYYFGIVSSGSDTAPASLQTVIEPDGLLLSVAGDAVTPLNGGGGDLGFAEVIGALPANAAVVGSLIPITESVAVGYTFG